jgi:two-component system cell cycle sensor histidine kinase/response regulator CckA
MFAQKVGLKPKADQKVVLIADDDPIARYLARLILESEGYFVLAANDGVEAIAISRDFSAPIHVVLTDVEMPLMDGTELRRRIVIERPTTRVLLMSASNCPIPNVPFVQKPLERAKLTELLHCVLSTRD